MKNKETTVRKQYLDIAKGVAILSIIAGHMNIAFIDRFVFTYHVPIFFIISGFLFKNKEGVIKKRFNRLLIPYVFTVFMIIFADELKLVLSRQNLASLLSQAKYWIIAGIYGSGSKNVFLHWKFPVIGAIWFLPAMLWACILLYIVINKCANIKMQIIIVLINFIIASISAEWTWIPFSIQAGMAGLLFIYIGYLNQHNLFMLEKPTLNGVITACFIWGVDLYFSYTNDCMSLVRCYFPNCTINILGSFAATYIILLCCRVLENMGKVGSFLSTFGQYSNVVLCFHLFELQIFPWKIVYESGIKHAVIVVFLLKIVWVCIGITLTKRIKILQKILM